MERFDKLLEKDIEGYQGEHSRLIGQAPALYRLMSRLLGDPALPRSMWKLVIAAIAYFIMPKDVIPEEIHGPKGYVDDIFLCALVAEKVREATGSDEILMRNWDGDLPVVPLIQEIISSEKDLVGDEGEAILGCVGFDELVESS
ncbi:MAG: DUF1232 domain-containing protein [Methanotrichaceae archaeon]|nr:DUF1232 domain-containing protein [Methanotrichaceae archaeon]